MKVGWCFVLYNVHKMYIIIVSIGGPNRCDQKPVSTRQPAAPLQRNRTNWIISVCPFLRWWRTGFLWLECCEGTAQTCSASRSSSWWVWMKARRSNTNDHVFPQFTTLNITIKTCMLLGGRQRSPKKNSNSKMNIIIRSFSNKIKPKWGKEKTVWACHC